MLTLLLVPLLFFGPGNDLDVGNIFKSGRSIVDHFHYKPSRAPGAPVHETAVGVLDRIGGPALTNFGSLAMAVVCGVALFALLWRQGVRGPGLFAVALVVLNPWFLIAATSTADYVWALAFVLLAAHSLRSDRPVVAGVFAALSMGCRIGSGLLIVAMLFAELFEGPRARRRVVITALVAAAGTLALFIPAFVASGSSLKFAENDFKTSTPLVQLGRTLVKDMLLLGPLATVLLLVALVPVVRVIGSWRTNWLVRFAVPGLLLSQVLFLRFPWKMPHLLPCLLCLAILLAVALDRRPALLYAAGRDPTAVHRYAGRRHQAGRPQQGERRHGRPRCRLGTAGDRRAVPARATQGLPRPPEGRDRAGVELRQAVRRLTPPNLTTAIKAAQPLSA